MFVGAGEERTLFFARLSPGISLSSVEAEMAPRKSSEASLSSNTDDLVPKQSQSIKTKGWFWEWVLSAKPTEWATVIVGVFGVCFAFQTGLFDAKRSENEAKKAETSAQNERLKVEQVRLEQNKESLLKDVALIRSEKEDLSNRLLPLEKQRDAILKIMAVKKRNPITVAGHSYRLGIDLGFDDEVEGWSLAIELTEPGLSWGYAFGASSRYGSVKSPVMVDALYSLIESASHIEKLRKLSIQDCVLTPDMVGKIGDCKELEALFLSQCRIDANAISRFKVQKTIRVLSLVGNQLTHIPFETGTASIEILHLNNNRIKDDGIPSVVSSCPKLKKLWLNQTEVSDGGLKYLIGLNELELVGIVATRVVGDGLPTLLDLPNLKVVEIESDRIKPEIRAIFKSKKPMFVFNSPPVAQKP